MDCSAVWCEPCHKIAPTFEALSKQYGQQLDFYGIDVQVNTYVAAKYKVFPPLTLLTGLDRIPSFIFIYEKGRACFSPCWFR